jgi:hypothetical protein
VPRDPLDLFDAVLRDEHGDVDVVGVVEPVGDVVGVMSFDREHHGVELAEVTRVDRVADGPGIGGAGPGDGNVLEGLARAAHEDLPAGARERGRERQPMAPAPTSATGCASTLMRPAAAGAW